MNLREQPPGTPEEPLKLGLPVAGDTVGEFISGVCKPRFRLPSTPHLAQLPAKRLSAGIRHQYPIVLVHSRESDSESRFRETKGPAFGVVCHFQKSIAFWVRSGLQWVRSGLHRESSKAAMRCRDRHLLSRPAGGGGGGRAGVVRLSTGVLIFGGRVALWVGGLGAVGLGNTEISVEDAHVLPDCHGTGRLCDRAGPRRARPRFCHLSRHVSCVLQRVTLRLM